MSRTELSFSVCGKLQESKFPGTGRATQEVKGRWGRLMARHAFISDCLVIWYDAALSPALISLYSCTISSAL